MGYSVRNLHHAIVANQYAFSVRRVRHIPHAHFDLLRRFLLSLAYPVCGFYRLLSQEHTELCAVLLHMAQVVQL
jgi:hypothetical protein